MNVDLVWIVVTWLPCVRRMLYAFHCFPLLREVMRVPQQNQ